MALGLSPYVVPRVHQGTILAPLLFFISISEITKSIIASLCTLNYGLIASLITLASTQFQEERPPDIKSSTSITRH
jgi:hypothetical protein